MLTDISRSTTVAGDAFPARADYETYAVQRGWVAQGMDLWQNHDLVRRVHLHWHQTGQSGCVFAQVSARQSERTGWRIAIADTQRGELSQPQRVKVGRVIEDALSDPGAELLSVLFPQVATPAEYGALVRSLLDTPMLFLGGLTEVEGMVALALRTPIVDGDRTVLSWALGFAPMPFLPVTRQAPVAELVLRTKLKPDSLYEKANADKAAAHLADIPLALHENAWARLWDATQERASRYLEPGRTITARAKVTFSMPQLLWQMISLHQLRSHQDSQQ